jgi:hypothetical protein
MDWPPSFQTGTTPPKRLPDDDRSGGGNGRETGEENRAAVDLLLAGRNAEALARYEILALKYPGHPVYGAIARLLRRQIAERCGQHPASMEEQCQKPQ